MFLIKDATIVDPNSSKNGKNLDILVIDGKIKELGENIQHPTAKTITGKALMVSPGWMDIGTQVGEPGLEHREDLQSVTQAAAVGGYTALACFPNTKPTIHSKSEVSFIKNKAQLVDFYPIGAVSSNCKGEELAEMYDMAAAGAVAFSDGSKSISSAGLMKRGLEYLKGIDGLLINQPYDNSLGKGGQIHEGEISTQLGMKGIPALSETLMLKRDLDLLEYTSSKLHVHNVSTAESVQLIKTAKKRGLKVTASTSVMNLVFTHEVLTSFDSNYKVLPPLREKRDVDALWKGLQDGVIDVINSNHIPYETESKSLEFVYAEFGAIGLETTFALLNTHLKNKLDTSTLTNLLANRPRKLFNIPIPTIEVAKRANLTIFSLEERWTFTEKNIYSKSKNTPLIGHNFNGRVYGVINGNYSNLI